MLNAFVLQTRPAPFWSVITCNWNFVLLDWYFCYTCYYIIGEKKSTYFCRKDAVFCFQNQLKFEIYEHNLKNFDIYPFIDNPISAFFIGIRLTAKLSVVQPSQLEFVSCIWVYISNNTSKWHLIGHQWILWMNWWMNTCANWTVR